MTQTVGWEDFGLDSIGAGSKWKGWIHLGRLPGGEPLRWPVLIVRGNAPGKVLLATAATHGDEYEGIAAIQETFGRLDPDRMSGTFLAIPMLNPPAVTAGRRCGIWDDRNLARTFPGDPAGQISQRIAHVFATRIIPLADLYIDLHAAGTGIELKPFVGSMIEPGHPSAEIQRQAAVAFGLPVIWHTPRLAGRTLSAAAEAGVPALYTESSGNRKCLPQEVSDLVAGLMNLLRFLGNLPGTWPTVPPKWVREDLGGAAGHMQAQHRVDHGGLFRPHVGVWDRLEEGQLLGRVHDPFGDLLEEVHADTSGRVLVLRICPWVLPGDFTAVVVPFPQ